MFPVYYHTHHARYNEDLRFWLDLAARCSEPILELGCGTGRVLLPLASAGHVVYGLDNDYEMLHFIARQLEPNIRQRVHLLQSDMSCFRLAMHFGLIILPCNTMSTLTQPILNEMLACVRQHLRPDGMFAASLPNPHVLMRMPKLGVEEVEEVFVHPEDGEPVQVSSAWERDEKYFSVNWYYDHLLPDGRVERLQANVKHQLFPSNTYLEALQATGFSVVHQYGSFHRTRYRKNSPHLILIAR